jgi:hypothetical protein
MVRRLDACLSAANLAGMSSSGEQGGPGSAGPGMSGGSVFASPAAIGQSAAQSRRPDEQHRLDSQQGRAEGEAHDRSAEARAWDDHAAHAARLVDKNSANRARRERRRELREKNRGDHGRK